MKKFHLLFLLLFLTLNSKAQKGYVITMNNDTIKCIVQKELIGDGAKYKLHKDDAFKEINPDSIREYQLSQTGTIYLLQYLHGTKTYVKCLEHGKISLYEEKFVAYTKRSVYGQTPVAGRCWYVTKGNFILQELPEDDLECRTFFMNLISDNLNLLIAFRVDNDVSNQNIQSYIERYNQAALSNAN